MLCHKCGTFNKNIVTFCNKCGDPVGLQLKYDVQECEERGMTYAAPLKVTIRLTVYDKDPETGNKIVRDIKEQEVFFGEIPLMTRQRHLHHQRHRARDRQPVAPLARRVLRDASQAQGYFLGKIIPYRGSWVEFEYDNKNLLYVRIDRKRKFYGTVFLRALGLKTDERDPARVLHASPRSPSKDKKLFWNVDPTRPRLGLKLSHAINTKGGETVVTQGKQDHRVALQGNPEGEDRAGRSRVQRSRRRLRGRRRGRHDDRRSLVEANSELTADQCSAS